MPLHRERTQAEGQTVSGETMDAERLRNIYEENLAAIYRFIYSKVGNREEAEDLTSQVFIKALRGIDGARGAQSIQSWLFHIARTTIADHWRWFYQLRMQSLEDLLAAGWEGPLRERQGEPPGPPDERVRRLLARLPTRYREVLTYRFLVNYSIKETAAKMNLTEANIKVLQFRALKKAAQIELDTV
ncbi:MAG: sigma-70 family RNA polymerase sigma factor [Ktedonobacterales bacterium]|nr:sigma-70 family RNA polymerase sigma factor [Ktedonobacterales bacterium]